MDRYSAAASALSRAVTDRYSDAAAVTDRYSAAASVLSRAVTDRYSADVTDRYSSAECAAALVLKRTVTALPHWCCNGP